MNKKMITTEVIQTSSIIALLTSEAELRIVVVALCIVGYLAACLIPLGYDATFPSHENKMSQTLPMSPLDKITLG